MPIPECRNTSTGKQIWMSTKAELFCGESILRFTAEIILSIIALTLQPIRGCPQHSGETGNNFSWGRWDVCRQATEKSFSVRELVQKWPWTETYHLEITILGKNGLNNDHKHSKVDLRWAISWHVLKISAVPGRYFAYIPGGGYSMILY